MYKMMVVIGVAIVLSAPFAGAQEIEAPEGFVPLFNGKDLTAGKVWLPIRKNGPK